MRKIISLTHATLDGYISGPNGEFDWIVYNDEMVAASQELTAEAGGAIYGRMTYEGMVGYWPTVLDNPNATEEELHHARWVHDIPKVVFSTTMEKAEWNNTLLIKDNLVEQVTKLKQQPGKDLLIFGSPRLTHSLAQLGLVDQYHININPVVLGGGTPLFSTENGPAKLNLLWSKQYSCGVIGSRYEVARA